MTSPMTAPRKPWYTRWWMWLAAVVVALIVVSAVANLAGVQAPVADPESPATSTVSAPPASLKATPTPVEETPATADDVTRLDAIRLALSDSYGGQQPADVFASDPTLWYGYLTDLRVKRANLYATLQVTSDDPGRRDLADRAARALSQLLPARQTNGIDYVVVEDATGTVILQQSTPAL